MENTATHLTAEIKHTENKLTARIDKLDLKINNLYLLVIGSILAPILLHFIAK